MIIIAKICQMDLKKEFRFCGRRKGYFALLAATGGLVYYSDNNIGKVVIEMLNENLRAIRKTKGLSQEELAAKLYVVRQTVSQWEKGLSVPDSDMLIAI